MFVQQQQNSGFGGLFGKPAQQPQSAGFGSFLQPQQQQQQPASTGFFGGQAAQTGAPSGIFGQPAQPTQFGNSTGFAQHQQQPQGGGIFGPQNPQQITPQPQSTGFFGGPMGMAQPQVSNFGTPAPMQNTGGFFGPQAAQPQQQLFGQPQQQQQAFQGQTGQSSQLFGTPASHAFGNIQQQQPQQKSSFYQQQQNQPAPAQGLFNQQQPQNTGQTIYSDPQFYNQSVSSINKHYQSKVIMTTDTSPPQQLTFTNIRSEDEFSRNSIQMIRIYDLKQMKGTPQQNYENLAMQEFNQNQSVYPLLQKMQQVMEGANKGAAKGQPQQTGLFANQNQTSQFGATQAFGASPINVAPQTQNQWGGQNQTPNQNIGGLFKSATTSSQPTSLFGSQTNQFQQPKQTQFGQTFGQNTSQNATFNPQTPQTGLFTDQKPQAGSLFAQNTPAPQGSIFGQPTQPPTQIGSLFNQAQQQTPSQFAGQQSVQLNNQQSMVPAPPVNSLFGQTTPTPNLGIFGPMTTTQPQINVNLGGLQQNPAQPTGLFNKQPAQPSGGLFDQNTLTASQPSLFGNNTANPPTTLFGNQPAAQPTGLLGNNSLFQTQPQTQQTVLFNQTPAQPQAFNQQPLGQQPQQQMPNQQNYLDLYNSNDPLGITNSFLSRDYPLENIQKEIDLLKEQIELKYPTPANQNQPLDYLDMLEWPDQQISIVVSMPTKFYQEEAARQKAKQDAKSQLLLQQQLRANRERYIKPSPQIQIYSSSDQNQQPSQRPNLSRLSSTQINYKKNPETITITCHYNYQPNETYSEVFDIHKSRDTSDLIKRVLNWFKFEFKFDGTQDEIEVFYKDKKLVKDQKLKDIGLLQDSTLKVKLIDQLQKNYSSQLLIEDEIAPKEILPSPPKQGYITSPPFEQLLKMTVKELEHVQDFQVSNEFGSIQWTGATDLTNVDLKDIVTIVKGSCEVYDDTRHIATKPSVGRKLNKPAVITLKNIKPSGNQSATAKEKRLKAAVEKDKDAEHLSYDPIQFVWQFKVQHFTKWGEDEDDEMDSAAASPPVQSPQTAQQQPQVIQQQPTFQLQQETVEEPEPLLFSQSSESQLLQSNYPNHQEFDIFEESKESSNPVQQKQQFNISQSYKRIKKTDPRVIQPAVFLKNQSGVFERVETQDISEKTKILNQIKQKELNLKDLIKRPSDDETNIFLSQFLQKDITKISITKRGVFKPCFNPNMPGILCVDGSKIKIKELPKVKEFSISRIIETHLTQQQNLKEKLRQMNLNDQDLEMTESRSKELFKDSFFRDMFNTELPLPIFFNSVQQTNDFLMDLARHYSSTQDNQLINEFQVVCMINALYGDPCRQLYLLQSKKLDFTNRSDVLDEQSLVASKKRRNAVTEVLRLVCQMEYPVKTDFFGIPSEEQIYQIALQLLEVGDVRQSVLFLNQHKKTKLALMVSQSGSNQSAMHFVQNSNLASGAEKQIINFISGKAQPSPQWEKKLLYSLMFQQSHSTQLKDIILEQNQQNQQVDSLLWKLLATYAKVKLSELQIQDLKGQLTPTHNPRDFRIRWIVQLVLRSVFLLKKQQDEANVWSCYIEDSIFTSLSSQYVNQLLLQNDSMSACHVTMLIPQLEIRKRLLFEILTKTSSSTTLNKDQGLYQLLQVPQKYITSAQALRLQNSNQSRAAVRKWQDCFADVHAQELYSKMVLPNNLKKEFDLNLLKKYYLPQSFEGQPELQIRNLDVFFTKMQRIYQSEAQWQSSICGLYQRVIQQQIKLTKSNQSENYNERIYQEIKALQVLIPSYQDPVTDWLRNETTEMLIAIRTSKANDTTVEHLINGITYDQAKRGCERILTKMLIEAK